MKLKRSERIVVMTEYLLNNPNKLIPLTYFVSKFNQAKSSISEDIHIIKNGHYLVDGWVPIQDVNALFHVQLPHEEVDTIGAYVYLEKYEAKVGAVYSIDKLTFVVRKVEENQIRTLEVWKEK